MAKNNQLFFTLCSLILCCSIFSGCSTYLGKDAYKDQPWIGSSMRAEGYYTVKDYIETYEDRFEWIVEGEKIIDSNDVIVLCENFLKRNSLWEEPKPIPIPTDLRYPWGIPEIGLSHSIVTELDASGQVVSTQKITHRVSDVGYENIRTIVCLDPIVVVSVPGHIVYYDFLITISSNELKIYEADFDVRDNGLYVILTYGYVYGTRMPYDPNPKWFSPDLDVAPRPVEILSEDKGRIPVPWGWLILNRENDEWVVTTESK